MLLETKLHLVHKMLSRIPKITQHEFQSDNNILKFSAFRLDRLGTFITGNKILKIAPNLLEYLTTTKESIPIATFGGSTSNHIRAFSAASRALRLNSIVFLRESPNGHHTHLKLLSENRGCKVILLSPKEYKNRENTSFISKLKHKHGMFYIMTEGGTSPISVRHIAKVSSLIMESTYDCAFVPVGLGGTLAGIASGLGPHTFTYGVAAIKADTRLNERVKNIYNESNIIDHSNWQISYDYHFGGFGKAKPELLEFADSFEKQTNIALNQTYTMKSAFAMIDLMKDGVIKNALWVNTYNPN